MDIAPTTSLKDGTIVCGTLSVITIRICGVLSRLCRSTLRRRQQYYCNMSSAIWSLSIGRQTQESPSSPVPTARGRNTSSGGFPSCCGSWRALWEPIKTAHRQNGPNEGRKRPTQTKTAPTKTAPMEEKTRPKRPQLTSKTAHYETLYKYRINDVIKCTRGIPYKGVDAAAVVAARRACVSTADMTLAPDADVLRRQHEACT